VQLLLDTHALLWWLFDNPALSAPARTALSTRENTVFVSRASAWEISTKWQLGRLPERVAEAGFDALPISLAHAGAAGALAVAHREPVDRMLIAPATLEGMVLVTRDEKISRACAHTGW